MGLFAESLCSLFVQFEKNSLICELRFKNLNSNRIETPMGKRILQLIGMLILTASSYAQGPNRTLKYYKYADGLTGEELKTAMFYIIRDPGVLGYSGLKVKYMETDVRADGFLRDWYSNATEYVPGSDFGTSIRKETDGYNREHLMPQSWYFKTGPMVSDIMQVVPTDWYINSRRNDLPFGEVVEDENRVKTSLNGYSKWGAPREDLDVPATVTTVFEPNDEVKGDIARIYFYMATCYQDSILEWTGNNANEVLGGTTYRPILDWEMDVMMRWSKLDPVDEVERYRNEAVYRVQYNRNPFVDYPGLEEYVWGEKAEEPFSYDFYEGEQQDPENIDIDDPDDGLITETTIDLNNRFFYTTWDGSRPTGNNEPIRIVGRMGNLSVIYSKGDRGQNMWCNGNEIRLYKHNTLTFRTFGEVFKEITFTGKKSVNTKVLNASTGTMDEFTWQGNDSDVVFYTDTENGNIRLFTAYVKLGDIDTFPTGIEYVAEENDTAPKAIYSIDGRKLNSLQPGLNIVHMKNGQVRKVLIRQ